MAGNQPRNISAHMQMTKKIKETDRLKRAKSKRNADAFVANGSPMSTASFGGSSFGGTTSGNALPSTQSTAGGGLFGGSFDSGNAGGEFNFSAGSSSIANPFTGFSQSTTGSSQQSVPGLSFSTSTPTNSFGEDDDLDPNSLEAQWRSGRKVKNPRPSNDKNAQFDTDAMTRHQNGQANPNQMPPAPTAQPQPVVADTSAFQSTPTPAPDPKPDQQPWESRDAPAPNPTTFFAGLQWGQQALHNSFATAQPPSMTGSPAKGMLSQQPFGTKSQAGSTIGASATSMQSQRPFGAQNPPALSHNSGQFFGSQSTSQPTAMAFGQPAQNSLLGNQSAFVQAQNPFASSAGGQPRFSDGANGSSTPAVQSVSFGHAAPTSNGFQFGGTQPIQPAWSSETPAAPPSQFSFLRSEQPAPPSNVFADSASPSQAHVTSQVPQQPFFNAAAPASIFGAPLTEPAPKPDFASSQTIFSAPKPESASSQSIFGTPAAPAPQPITASSQPLFPPQSAPQLAGPFAAPSTPQSDNAPVKLFATQQFTPQLAGSFAAPSTPKSDNALVKPSAPQLAGPFAAPKFDNASVKLFKPQPPAPQSAPQPLAPQSAPESAPESAPQSPAPQPPAPELANTFVAPSTPKSDNASVKQPIFSTPATEQQSLAQLTGSLKPDSKPLYHPLDSVIGGQHPKALRAINGIDTSVIESRFPAGMSQSNRHIFVGHHRLKTLKALYLKHIESLPLDADLLEPAKYYAEKREAILKDIENKIIPNLGPTNGKRKDVPDFPDSTQTSKKSRHENGLSMSSNEPATANASQSQPYTGTPAVNMTAATSTTPQFIPPASAVNSTPSASPAIPQSTETNPSAQYTPSLAKSKRKADVQLTKDFPTEEDHDKSDRSKTSQLFSDVLDGKVPTPATSPRKIAPLKKKAGIGSQGSQVPKSPTKIQTPFMQLTSSADSNKAEIPPAAAPTPMTPAPIKNPFQIQPTATTTPTTAPPVNPFQIKSTAAPSMPSAIKPPTFGPVAATDFLSQFGKKVEETEAKALKEAIENDMDSDEDEEEFTARFKAKREEQKAQQAKELANIKGGFKLATFAPSEESASKESSVVPESSGSSTPAQKPSSSTWFPNITGSGASSPGIASSNASVFDGASQKKPAFAGFSVTSTADKSHDSNSNGSDAEDNEESGEPQASDDPVTSPEETAADPAPAAPSSGSGGLFDRISKDTNGKPMFDKENVAKVPSALFSTTSSFSSSTTPADNTWKPDTPIKFGTSDAKTPATTFGASTSTPIGAPSAPALSFYFSASQPATFGGNLGAAKPATSIFRTTTATMPATTTGSIFGNPGATKSNTTSIFSSAAGSMTTSRESSVPFGQADDNDDDMPKLPQVDLTVSNFGEEDEEVVHKFRAKALLFSNNKWNTKGLGPLKVLRHKETGACRIVLRADPSGAVILNKGLISAAKYEAAGKTVNVLGAANDGKSLESWILQLKTPEEAEELSALLLENKPQS